jgi:endoglucanase
MQKLFRLSNVLIIHAMFSIAVVAQNTLKLNKKEYFGARGLNVLLYHNYYPDGKQGGLEIIQHEVRIATNGDLRLEQLPQQWSAHTSFDKREVFPGKGEAVVYASFPNKRPSAGVFDPGLKLKYNVHVIAEEKGFRIIVNLETPLPKEWEGRVGYQLEFFPSAYFGKSYRFEKMFGIFNRQPNGPVVNSNPKSPEASPLGEGYELQLAPEDPEHAVNIESSRNLLSLYDGRNSCQNGWFIVRSVVPSGATKNAIEWKVIPNQIQGWIRKPVIAYSQVGYCPSQQKTAVLELDTNDVNDENIILQKVSDNGSYVDVLNEKPGKWGFYLRYNYSVFDFSKIKEEGVYRLKYSGVVTENFKIKNGIYDLEVWQPTLEVLFPIQMCHMRVIDNYRVWHGLCHMDDALQAPYSPNHFDQYVMDSITDTRYKPFEHIQGLTAGGWHDAGDYDLPAGQRALYNLLLTQEEFPLSWDQTTISQKDNFVELHRPDGKPDLLQQIEHGVLNKLTGYWVAGHSFCGIIDGDLRQYAHLGDASTITDGYIYDPKLGKNEKVCNRSGNRDDRWAFTNKDAGLEYRAATELALAARVLKDYNDSLSAECFQTANQIWNYEQSNKPVRHFSEYVPRNLKAEELKAAVELYLTTNDKKFKTYFLNNMTAIDSNFYDVGWTVSRIVGKLNDQEFKNRFDKAVEKYKSKIDEMVRKTPYGLPFDFKLWGAGDIFGFAFRSYYFAKVYPSLFDREDVLKVLNYCFGYHMVNSTSMVSGVGAKSKIYSYGGNRADWYYIPGGVCSGPSFILPDFPEFRDDFPFLWQQSEVTVAGCSIYLFLTQAGIKLLNQD